MARVRYERLATEQPNPASRALDRMSPLAVARHLEVPEDRVVRLRQVHGDRIHVITPENREALSPAAGLDAVMTDEPGLLLTVATADCVPILLADPVRKAVAAVHAGCSSAPARTM